MNKEKNNRSVFDNYGLENISQNNRQSLCLEVRSLQKVKVIFKIQYLGKKRQEE
jgi:hypothetical protein